MKLRREYKAREIARMSDDELLKLPEGGLILTFDDNTVSKCKTFKTVYVAPFWEFVLNHGGKITQSMSMCRTDKDGNYIEDMYRTNTHLSMSERVFWDTFYRGKECDKRFWEMSMDIYRATNRIHNYNVSNDLSYMSCGWLEDSMEVLLHPKIQEYKAQYVRGELSINECHDKCYHVVETDTEYFGDNDVHLSVRCGLLSKVQVKQMIGPRGNVPDINSEAFPHPIEPGYYERLTKASDSVNESKTASIALYMQGGPLEDSEYNNRLCQLMCSYIRRVVYRDCGSRDTLNVFVPDQEILTLLVGKNVLTEKGEYRIRGDETEFIGKTLSVRSAATCHEEEQGVVCSKCLGQAAYVVPPNASPGHVLIIDVLGQITQTLLSTKHVLSNVIALTLSLDRVSKNYFKIHEENKFVVMMNDSVDIKNLKIRIPHSQVQFISDIEHVEDPGNINVTATSDVFDVVFCNMKDGIVNKYESTDVSVSSTGSCLTREALIYIKENSWDIVGDMIEIDMANWNMNDPLLVTKRVSQDVTETLRQFKAFISPTKDPSKRKIKSIVDCTTVEEAIDCLHSLLKGRISSNYVQLEMFVTALMAGVDTYRLPNGKEDYRFITQNDSLSNRSALVSLGYQAQCKYLMDPDTYLKNPDDIPPHEMDGLLAEGFGFHV